MADVPTITGIKELDEAFDKLEPAIQKKILRPAVRAGAKVVLREAKQLAPSDSGDLIKSMKVRAMKRSKAKDKKHRVGAGVNAGADTTGPGLPFYAVMIEFGTAERQTKAGWPKGRVEPDPFLRPALYENQEEVKQEFIKIFRRKFDQVVSGLAKKAKVTGA